MISFDDFINDEENVNLSPIYNSISTLSSNSYELYTMITNIPTGNKYMINFTDTTFTDSPKNYLYNISGDINVSDLASTDEYVIHGDINSFVGSNISGINKLEIGNIDKIESININVPEISISGNDFIGNSLTNILNVSLQNKNCNNNYFSSNSLDNVAFNSFLDNTFFLISDLKLNGGGMTGNTFNCTKLNIDVVDVNSNTLNANVLNANFRSATSNTFYNYIAQINGSRIVSNTISGSACNINAMGMFNNTLSIQNLGGIINTFWANSSIVSEINGICRYYSYNTLAHYNAHLLGSEISGNVLEINGILDCNYNGIFSNLITNSVGRYRGYNISKNQLTNTIGEIQAAYSMYSNTITDTLIDITCFIASSNTIYGQIQSMKGISLSNNSFFNNQLHLQARTLSSNYITGTKFNISCEDAENNSFKYHCLNAEAYSFKNNTLSASYYGWNDISALSFTNNSMIGYGGEYYSLMARWAQMNNFSVGGIGYFNALTLNYNTFSYGILNVNLTSASNNTFLHQTILNLNGKSLYGNSFNDVSTLNCDVNIFNSHTLTSLSSINITAGYLKSNEFNKMNVVNIDVNSLESYNTFNDISKLYLKYKLSDQQQTFNNISSLYTPDYFTFSDNSYSVGKFYIENIDTLFDSAGSYTFSEDISKMYAQYVPFSLLKPGSGGGSTPYMKAYASTDGNYQYNLSGSLNNSDFKQNSNVCLFGPYTISGLTMTDSFNRFDINCNVLNSFDCDKLIKFMNITADSISMLGISSCGKLDINAYSLSYGGMFSCNEANIKAYKVSLFTPISMFGDLHFDAWNVDTVNFYSGNRTINIANSCSSISIEEGRYAEFSAVAVYDLNASYISTLRITAGIINKANFENIQELDLNEVKLFADCTFKNIGYLKLPSITKSTISTGYEINVTNSAITSLDIRHLPDDVFVNGSIPLYALQSYNVRLHNTSMLLENGIKVSRYI